MITNKSISRNTKVQSERQIIDICTENDQNGLLYPSDRWRYPGLFIINPEKGA